MVAVHFDDFHSVCPCHLKGRMAVSLSAFSKYDNMISDEITTALTAKVGYLWEWKYIFTSLETGLGPGFHKNKKNEDYRFDPKVVDAYLNLGFIF